MHAHRIFLATLLLTSQAHAGGPASAARLDQVAERGAHVMPFSLEKTVHVFEKTDTGGLQLVLAKDAADAVQIGLIREHLAKIAHAFAQGDFSGPERIHGATMPGLAELRAGAEKAKFEYRDSPGGGQIVFASDDPALVDAIHRYFDAQLSDHARHVVPTHEHWRMHDR